ncbi:MAG: hypothetical protein EOS54_11780 [Mesorhizobium sp.]|uniref:hypothetical protein n=1 Tax=Mesorhizobium sp. TaxID=1871066 RepID=UPI000FE98BA2|nr:hypothetical protein [Mesorhizobium sp.]RWC53854.1 MAG: hypothetical protein EOS54_11780 [Mesorhizobium sp.]TIV83160.1 MAG: hypothetical protein E5V64_09225 [Mesorhizobium sp.]TIX16668.1 MAG: hypothetical protein E5V46_01845 [Mesorhizobium sp.]TIX66595.1 MAG: hypothetical protein E5V30_24940 [Mesorhizobium sp.]
MTIQSIDDLVARREALKKEHAAIVGKADDEGRELSESEWARLDAMKAEGDAIFEQLAAAARRGEVKAFRDSLAVEGKAETIPAGKYSNRAPQKGTVVEGKLHPEWEKFRAKRPDLFKADEPPPAAA